MLNFATQEPALPRDFQDVSLDFQRLLTKVLVMGLLIALNVKKGIAVPHLGLSRRTLILLD